MKFYLSGNDWFLTGWNKHTWLYDRPNESGAFSIPLITKIPADGSTSNCDVCIDFRENIEALKGSF